jgi:ubiquitin-conjugating enzyme E2 J2
MNQQTNATTDISLTKRNKNALQQHQQQQTLMLNNLSADTQLHHQQQQTQQQQQQHPITRTVSRGKRWLFVLVVFVYLILSKLIARSTTTSSA